jgi:hypothetical protein
MRLLACAALAVIAAAACTDTDSATDLNTGGPPMIRQVLLEERVIDGQGKELGQDRVFAFGTHPDAEPSDVHAVRTALAMDNKLRVVIDELLVGNFLEELACRDGSYSRIPAGADPDDIARCSVPNNLLAASCPASDRHAVCICREPAGCTIQRNARFPSCPLIENILMVPEGAPVGTMDCNQDGAADDMRLIAGAVGIQCGSIAVPIDQDRSYWNPSGTQNKPAMGGFDALGPAIVLIARGPLPTGIDCTLTFSSEVVDKQGEQVCAPSGGDVSAGCTPGDVSAFAFGVEPLRVRPPQVQNNVPKAEPVLFIGNAPFDPGTLGGIQIAPAPPGAVTISLFPMMPNVISIAVAGGWAPQTTYDVTFPTTLTDTFGRPLPEARTHRFTTGN